MKIFLSSTENDLRSEREVVYWALIAAGHEVIRMEEFGTRSQESWEVCVEQLDDCQAYVLLLGRRYGSILGDSGLSYTHAEYERAQIKGLSTLAYIKRGAVRRRDSRAEPIRLREFSELVSAAHQRRPYFSSLNQLALWVREDVARLGNAAPQAPKFHAIRRSLANPTDYAIARVERDLLKGNPYEVIIADLHLLMADIYPDAIARRLTNKALQLRADLARRGIDARLFNEIAAYGASEAAVVSQRARQAMQANAIVALIQQPADLALATEHLSSFAGPLILCYPESMDEPAPPSSQVIAKRYTVKHLNSCELVSHVHDALRSSIDSYVLSLAA